MALRDKNQMIDQIDAQPAQEKRGVVGRAYVGVARPRAAGRMIVCHDHFHDTSAQHGAPASRRYGAAPRAVAIRALEPDEPPEGVEAGEKQRFAPIVEQGTQKLACDGIFERAWYESRPRRRIRHFADWFGKNHPRPMLWPRAIPNAGLPRIGCFAAPDRASLVRSRDAA